MPSDVLLLPGGLGRWS